MELQVLRKRDLKTRVQRVMFILVLIHAITEPTYSLETYEFSLGTNASVHFVFKLNSDQVTSFEIFTLNAEQPFYTLGRINPTALRPEQRGRFEVTSSSGVENFTVTLIIYTIQDVDKGVYVLIVREDINGQPKDSIIDAYVDVTPPLGKAECSIRESDHYPTWHQVECNATLGGDKSGSLMCYQNSNKLPTNGPISYSSTHITAVFWMNIEFPINCCSLESDSTEDPNSCTDFIHNLGNVQYTSTQASRKVTLQNHDNDTTSTEAITVLSEDSKEYKEDGSSDVNIIILQSSMYPLFTFQVLVTCVLLLILLCTLSLKCSLDRLHKVVATNYQPVTSSEEASAWVFPQNNVDWVSREQF